MVPLVARIWTFSSSCPSLALSPSEVAKSSARTGTSVSCELHAALDMLEHRLELAVLQLAEGGEECNNEQSAGCNEQAAGCSEQLARHSEQWAERSEQ